MSGRRIGMVLLLVGLGSLALLAPLALRAWVANLLDSPQQDMVGLPLPGRTFHGSAELSWW